MNGMSYSKISTYSFDDRQSAPTAKTWQEAGEEIDRLVREKLYQFSQMNYKEALAAVLADNPGLKEAYARV